jgi:hypothetical protein
LNVDRNEEESAPRGEANYHASHFRDHQETELKHLEAEVSELRSELSSEHHPEEIQTAPESEVIELRQELNDAKRQLEASKLTTRPRRERRAPEPDLATIEQKIRDDVAEAARLMHTNVPPSKEVLNTEPSAIVVPSAQASPQAITRVHAYHNKARANDNVEPLSIPESPPTPAAGSIIVPKVKEDSVDAGLEKSIEQEAGAFNQNASPCLPPLLC